MTTRFTQLIGCSVPIQLVAELVDEATGEKFPIGRLESVTPRRGNIAAMPHWAGESVGGVKRVQPAPAIVRELMEECERRLSEASIPHRIPS